jgi:hypothetical protein
LDLIAGYARKYYALLLANGYGVEQALPLLRSRTPILPPVPDARKKSGISFATGSAIVIVLIIIIIIAAGGCTAHDISMIAFSEPPSSGSRLR